MTFKAYLTTVINNFCYNVIKAVMSPIIIQWDNTDAWNSLSDSIKLANDTDRFKHFL